MKVAYIIVNGLNKLNNKVNDLLFHTQFICTSNIHHNCFYHMISVVRA